MPLATGKLSIWTENTNAAASPASGTSLSSIALLACLTHTPIAPTATTPAASRRAGIDESVWNVHARNPRARGVSAKRLLLRVVRNSSHARIGCHPNFS